MLFFFNYVILKKNVCVNSRTQFSTLVFIRIESLACMTAGVANMLLMESVHEKMSRNFFCFDNVVLIHNFHRGHKKDLGILNFISVHSKKILFSKIFSVIERECYCERCEEFNNNVKACRLFSTSHIVPPGKTR